MDATTKGELRSLIEKLVRSGNPSLDEGLVKKVKAICKRSDANVRGAYTFLMESLTEEHSEIRLSAFQLVEQLFQRSHFFRQLLTLDFQRLVTLVCGVDPHNPLPPPRPAADKLKEASLLAIRQWVGKFGDGYPKLKIGFNYLKHNKKVDFEGLVAASEGERRRQEQREARNRALLQQRLEEVQQEMQDQMPEIHACLMEIESCFQLLLPRYDLPSETMPHSADSNQRKLPPPSNTHSKRHSSASESNSRHVSCPHSQAGCHGNGKHEGRICSTTSSGSFHSIGHSDSDLEESEKEMEPEEVDTDLQRMQEQCETNATGRNSEVDSGTGSQEVDRSGHDQEMKSNSSEDSDSDVEWGELLEAGGGGDGANEGMCGLAAHGIVRRGFALSLDVSRKVEVEEGEDNESIIATLRERQAMLDSKFFPMINKWIEWFTRAGKEQSLKEAIDLKGNLSAAKQKYSDLHIVSSSKGIDTSKRDSPGTVKKNARPMQQQQHERTPVDALSVATPDLSLDPTTWQAQVSAMAKRKKGSDCDEHRMVPSQSSSRTVGKGHKGTGDKLRSVAPVLPYDVDLYNWESGFVPEPLVMNLSSLHRFYGGEEREITVPSDYKALMQCRVRTFESEFEPVKWTCRAPLPNGKLCPRQDRTKCPFHGRIIARDEQGRPTEEPESVAGPSGNDDEVAGKSADAATSAMITWKDLEDDVLQMTGNAHLLLKGKDKKKKSKGKRKGKQKMSEPSGLTDLSALSSTPRSRIGKKIFNKKSMKRVADTLNKLERKRVANKLEDSFSYGLKS